MTADDEFAVRNVIARLALYADGPDVDAYSDLFTADAVLGDARCAPQGPRSSPRQRARRLSYL
jgi:hypothetical protein